MLRQIICDKTAQKNTRDYYFGSSSLALPVTHQPWLKLPRRLLIGQWFFPDCAHVFEDVGGRRLDQQPTIAGIQPMRWSQPVSLQDERHNRAIGMQPRRLPLGGIYGYLVMQFEWRNGKWMVTLQSVATKCVHDRILVCDPQIQRCGSMRRLKFNEPFDIN